MGSPTVWHALMRPPWRFLASRWPWLALVYLAASAALGLVLLPVAVATLLILPLWGIAIGALERRRTRILGFLVQRSGHVPLAAEQRPIWLSVRITEGATWRETAALVVDVVAGLAAVVVLFFEAVMLAVLVAIAVFGARGGGRIHLFGDVRPEIGPGTWWPVVPLAFVALCLFGYANALLAAVQASALRALCGPRNRELARNVERLLQSRATLVEAFEAERRRIERDLHDGVQQELVTLAARLGMVSIELDDLAARGADAAAASAALGSVQCQAERAMATLRDTVRGIHPALLADHGLAAALDDLASRAPLPLDLDVAGLGRLPAPVETTAYFLVTEATTNAAKHASATRLTVRARIADGALVVTAADDGRGGADETVGTGLRGLREHAETLGGAFSVRSPAGGPTILSLSLPLTHEGVERDAAAAR
ncbi:sensor histidine kinase [Microbacterium sp. gxy059]|uniref:sensor histidine kinase n=1 Tax=Microbacterium sp. gxy059 TaxID=2957199 RepID=UPI003D968A3C